MMPDKIGAPGDQIPTAALDAKTIAAHLAEDAERWEVRAAWSVDSTNSVLMREAQTGAASGAPGFSRPVLLAAENQTAGRGRQGRSWLAAPYASLTISFGWRMRRSTADLSGLSLACGLAVRRALAPHGVACQMKWPNDVLVDRRKLAGILVETRDFKASETQFGETETFVVIGIGINVTPASHRPLAMGPKSESVGKSPAATDLLSEIQGSGNFGNSGEARPDRNRLAAEIARSLAGYLKSFEKAGFAQFADEWNCAHAYRGERMQLIEHGQIIARGVARGVDAAGRLCIETPEGVRSFLSGDVSLRPA